MRSEQEIIESINNLRSQLGEDQFTPQSDDSIEAIQERVNALDRQLASTPESFKEYVERRKVEDARSLGQKSSAFLDSFMEGGKALAKEGANAIGELFSGEVGTEELGGVYEVGKTDFGRFAKTIGGSVMDNFYSDEEEMRREYQRYKDNFLYNQEVRPAMLNTYDEEGRDFVSFGANFIDPTLLVPAGGLIAKGGSLGAKAVASGAKGVSKAAKAGAFAARSPRLIKLSRAMAQTSRGVDKVAKGADKVATGLGKASEIASIPSQLFAKGTRGAIKGTAKAGQFAAQAIGKGGEITSKVASTPRSVITKIASSAVDPKVAGSGILGAQVVAAGTGAIPGLGLLTATEGLGYIANKTGRGMERVLGALSSSAGQKRFLQRLATSAESKAVRRAALFAHRYGGTRLGDISFNMLANGATVGSLNAALAYAAGEGPEGVGAAAGSGAVIGGALPFGQSGMRGGKTQKARDEKSISNFLDAKLAQEQREQFSKLSPEAKLAFATVEEAGIKAPTLEFLDGKTYLNLLREETPNLRNAPEANLDEATNTITVNTDGSFKKASELALEILSHELGHGFIRQAIKDDPFFASKILKEYQPKKGEESFEFSFTTDSAGSPIDSIQVNSKAKQIAELYDGIQEGIAIGTDANTLAQEIGAEQFAMMMVDNGGNLFKSIEPSLRQKLLDASRKVLGLFGVVDPPTGNPLNVSILGEAVFKKNPILQRSKTIRNLYKNYVEQKEKSLIKKIDLADNPISLKLEKGENAQQAVQRLFSTKGLSLKEAGAFRINNRQVKKKLIDIKNRLFQKPEGEMSAETNKKGNPISIVGKKLTDELKGIFTRNDPFGNINTLINMATEAIMQNAQMTMLYRAGKPSKYSDNELRPRVIAPVQFKITGLADSSRSAASLKLDAFDEAYLRNNAEVLVAEGFEKNPNNLIELGRQVALDAMNDPEGRINPKGKYENEVVTALFGQPESAPQIRNPKLRRLLEEKRLKHAYRTYDIDGLAGLVPTGKSGISFDWFNVRNNYMPYDQNLFMPRQSKNFDKKVALRTNEDIIKQIDILAEQKGVSRNDLLNEILRDRVTEKTPDDSGIPVDSENVPPITEKEFQNLKDQSQKKSWSEDSDQDLNWLRNEPRDRLFMPAVNVEQRRAEKYGKMFQDAVKSDKEIIAQARRDWMENGFKAENFQAWITSGLEKPALAREKNGIFEPIKLYYGGPLGMAKRPGFNPAAPLEILQKSEYAEGITRKADDQYTSDKTIILTDNKNLAKQEQESTYPGVKPLEFATNANFIFDPLYSQHLELLKKSIRDIEPDSPELAALDQLSSQPEDIYAYENLLKQAGWDGYRIPGKDGDGFAIFDAKKVKLIADQAGEGKFFTKDRPYGKVSGLFGRPLPSEKMSSMGSRSRGSDVRFMPQMELDFDVKSQTARPTEQSSQGISFWKLFGIDKNDKEVYKKVAEKLINTGSPDMDPQTALDYSSRLGLDVKRLRQEMEKAQARYRRENRLYMPKSGDYMHKSGGLILPDGSFIKKYTDHNIDLFEWVKNNPKNPFAQKMEKAEKMHKERNGKKVGFHWLENGLREGAIRIARDSRNSKNIYIESRREIPSRLKRELIDQAMMAGNTLILDRGSREQVIFDPGNKLFMPASEAGAGKGKQAEAAKLWQEKGTDSPYFKKWFGKSKVVDENGEPLVVYHGTDKQFTSFDPEKSIGGQNWFTSDKSAIEAGEVGAQGKGIIMETYLNIEKPASWAEYDKFTIDELIGRGYDGLILPESDGTATYVTYSPEQIKSATGNRGTFDAGERNILFMPASEAKNPKSGDMLTLDDKSLKLFLPSPSNPNASLSEFKGKNVQVLTADLSVVGDKKADGVMISFTGGPGYLSVNDAWGFTNEAGAKAFKTRWERDGKPLIGITSMKQENHRASTLTREYYVRKFMEAINDGKISENTVNRHIKTALKRAIDGKNGLTNNQKAALKTVKTIEDFLKVFPDKELIPWKATPMIYGKLDAKTLPIKQDRLKKLGLDTETILRETRQPEYNDIKKGSLLAIAEYDGSGATYRPDLNSAYPWSIPLNEKAFLKDFADIQDLSSRPDLRGSDGEANMAVAMGAGVMLDKLGRGDVNFMPSDPKAPKAQPANRIQQQAPAMPGNRFMAPAASAGAKLSERFR